MARTWLDVRAELLLVAHALLQQAVAEPDVVCVLHLLPEQLLLALPADLARVVPLQAQQRENEPTPLPSRSGATTRAAQDQVLVA